LDKRIRRRFKVSAALQKLFSWSLFCNEALFEFSSDS
jgi:hypothetical protein